MAPAGTEFIRQTPRVSVHGSVTITLPNEELVTGELLDLSACGLSVRVDRRIRVGTRLAARVEPTWTPGELEHGLPTVAGTVTWLREEPRKGLLGYRVGVAFAAVPSSAAGGLRMLVAQGTGGMTAVDLDAVAKDLALSAGGRERLYQTALERLAAGEYEGARAAVRASLSVIPHARHMRALLCRVEAEAALAAQKLDEARRRVGHGRRLVPDDPVWDSIEKKLDDARPRGFWSRLRGAS
jgi:hypothetical protein